MAENGENFALGKPPPEHDVGDPTTSASIKEGKVIIDMDAPGVNELDYADRDPTRMNSHVRVGFEEVFAEPVGMHSLDGVWKWSYLTFFNSKFWCYRLITLLCAVPASIFWGFYFACLTFLHIWCVVPSVKAFMIYLQCAGKMFKVVLVTFVEPIYIAFSKIFSGIRVTVIRE